MSEVLRQCPECGCDRWKHRDAERSLDRRYQLDRDIKKLAAENGVHLYERMAQEEKHKNSMSRALRKIQRQARVIVRLEKRLRDLEVKPYADSPLGESAPAAEYDVEHPDA